MVGAVTAGLESCYPLVVVGMIYTLPAFGERVRVSPLYSKTGVDLVLVLGGLSVLLPGKFKSRQMLLRE